MKKILIELVLLFIPFKDVRNRWRRILRGLTYKGLNDLKLFKNHVISDNTVLLLEANDCHAEVLPGYAKYFLDLGYQVDVLTSKENLQEQPFCRYDEKVNLFELNPWFIFLLHRLPIIKKYKNIMITSSRWYAWETSVVKFFNLDKLENLFIVEHDIDDIAALGEEKYLENKKLVMLWDFQKGVMVNPHYFGNVDTTHLKNKKTNFIVVGSIEKQRKNHDLLINAVREIAQKTQDFKITVVGRGSVDTIEESLRGFFDIKGRLDFPNLYKELEQADYFLPLLDYENEAHHRYLTTGATGSFQLILTFLKPAVIQKNFADFYKLNNENSIVYEKNSDLAAVMLNAIFLSNDEYVEKKKFLSKLQKDIFQQSIESIKSIM